MSGKYRDDQVDPFAARAEELSMQEIDDALYGSVELPESGRVVVTPRSIYDIWPDVVQPRRKVPLTARGEWDGNPEDVQHVLAQWDHLAQQMSQERFTVLDLLERPGDGPDKEAANEAPLVSGYRKLLKLAGSIYHDGLNHAITVVPRRGVYVIESGERRWLAYHVLAMYIDADRYSRIPAVQKAEADVWRQAAENGARQPLNAIGMARQLALLIMDMYSGDEGVAFDAYEQMVLPGESDRRFYAQVANGNRWRVKRGMGERMMEVTGLGSQQRIGQYRALLNLPDEMWIEADENDWTEGSLRRAEEPESEAENANDQGYTTTNVVVSPLLSSETVEIGEDKVREGFTDTPPKKYYRLPDEGDFEDREYVSVPPSTKEQLASRGHDFPTPPLPGQGGVEEGGIAIAIAGEAEGESLESTRPLLLDEDHNRAYIFLEALVRGNASHPDMPHLEVIHRELCDLSPERVREIVVRSGGATDYQTILKSYEDNFIAYLKAQSEEVESLFTELFELGLDMESKYVEGR
jgi:hypothetical protein